MKVVFDVESIILGGGLLVIALIVFSESGLLLGFFLPGDSLLIAAGFLAGAAKFSISIEVLIATVVLAAIIGYETGYEIGKRAGPKVFKRTDGVLFRQEYVERANGFFDRYGALTVIMARFVPIVRTVVSTVAGVGKMDRRKFTIYNVVGAVLWGGGLTWLGYQLGSAVPDFDKFLVPGVIIATIGTVGIAFWHVARTKDRRQQLKKELKEEWHHFFGSKKS